MHDAEMLSNFRLLLSITLFFSSWSLMIGSIVYLGQYASDLFDIWVMPMWNDGIAASMSLTPEAVNQVLNRLIISRSTDIFFEHTLSYSITMGGVVLSAHILLIWLRPLEKDVLDSVRGVPIKRISLEEGIGLIISEMAEKAGIRKPQLYISESDDVNAFVIGKPFRDAIVLTAGTMKLPEGHRLWIIGHEMGHIKRGDSTPTMLWIAAKRTSVWFYNTRIRIIQVIHPVLVRLPLIRLFVFPVEAILFGAFHATAFADYISMKLFTVIDRSLLRSVEYRADVFASNLVGAQYGVEVMAMLGYSNRTPSLMDSHPPAFKREKRLRKLAERT